MADNATLQEAIQRARQLAAKISQNAPVKRTASELEDHTIGTVKVTHAYEKPANFDAIREQQRSVSNQSFRDSNPTRDNYPRDRDPRDRDRERDRTSNERDRVSRDREINRDRSRERDMNDREPNFSGGNLNSNTTTNNSRSQGGNNSLLGSSYGGSMLSGSANIQEEKIEIILPHDVIGLIIGKRGENIRRIQNETGATVRVDPTTVDEKGNKVCTITGTKKAVDDAHEQISIVIKTAGPCKKPRGMTDGEGGHQRMRQGNSRSNNHHNNSSNSSNINNNNNNNSNLHSNHNTNNPNLGQQNPADMSAAWAAYFAQYSTMFNQPGAAAAIPGMPYAGPSLLNQSNAQLADPSGAQQNPTMLGSVGAVPAAPMVAAPIAQPQAPQMSSSVPQEGQSQDYTDQWIEFYMMNGRPDYAEQIMEMKKQQQAQQQQQQH